LHIQSLNANTRSREDIDKMVKEKARKRAKTNTFSTLI